MANAFKWDYSKIKNFPEGGTIQRSGNGLIVIRRKTVYDSTIKRGKDAKREYLGRVVDGVFYSREEYAQKFQKGGVPRRVPLIAPVESLEVPEAFKSLSDEEFAQLLTLNLQQKKRDHLVALFLMPAVGRFSARVSRSNNYTQTVNKSIFCL